MIKVEIIFLVSIGGSEPLRYYNYLFNYGPEAELTIDNLPLITGSDLFKREYPIQYQELKDWMVKI